MVDYASIRRDYANAALDEAALARDPFEQFDRWFKQALEASVMEPNAMNLATVGEGGRPSVRVVLLKGIENNRFVFYTNRKSRKARELAGNRACAGAFYWPELARQIRIEGTISWVSEQASTEYFQSRPREAQISAWASVQSEVIENRAQLELCIDKVKTDFQHQSVLPKPADWGGYAIEADQFEFWQGRQSRLHDRIRYVRTGGFWKIERLAP